MPEFLTDFPRAWVEFADPGDDSQRFKCDLTWLTSRWQCIFGQGCQGIYAESPDTGCCTLGAHFSDTDDEKRVARAAKKLTDSQWQYKSEAAKNGWAENEDPSDSGDEPARKTRVVDGACIFHNRPDFARGAGCALHLLALDNDISFVETKPDVCWQLPQRRSFRSVTTADGAEHTEVTISEYVRAGWGPGGHDLDWYCTSNSAAHHADSPVYRSNQTELTELMGAAAYAVLVDYCVDFENRRSLLIHPATKAAREEDAAR